MGSIVGALSCKGLGADDIEAIFREVDWPKVGTVLVGSVIGSAFYDLLTEFIGQDEFEDLRRPLAAVCCDLDTAEEVVIRRGRVVDAVRASSAIPGILSAFRIAGRNLVDGAVIEPVPVKAAADLGPFPVVAVNVLKPPAPDLRAIQVLPRRSRRSVRSAVRDRIDRWLQKRRPGRGSIDMDVPGRREAVLRSFHIMQYQLAAARYGSDDMIEPEVGRFGWFDFSKAAEIIEEGYHAYRRRYPVETSAGFSDRSPRV
jgi:NTE family protein